MTLTSTTVSSQDTLIVISNHQAQLVFDATSNGSLVSILDRTTNYSFRRDERAPALLYRLALRRASDKSLEWIDNTQATSFRWNCARTDDGTTLSLDTNGFPQRPTLHVRISITLPDHSAFSTWRFHVSGLPDAALYQITCPVVTGLFHLGHPYPGESLAVPRLGEGYLFRYPFPVRDRLPLCAGTGPDCADVGLGELHGLYPGQHSIQLLLYLNDTAALYLATHDASQHVKSFDVAPWPADSLHPAISISHFPGERFNEHVAPPYDTILGIFHGDWYDGADIYRTWASQQWWCKHKLQERDIPSWMRTGFAVFQMSNYHLPKLNLNHSLLEIADTVNTLSAESNVPLAALIFNWEHYGGWTGPVGLLPPREGEQVFRRAMHQLHNAGNLGFVYIPGGQWYLRIASYPFDSWAEFELTGRPIAVKNVRGTVDIGRWYEGWEGARLCAHTPQVQSLTRSMLLQCLELGCKIVQIDNFPIGGAEACYDPSHGHPLGYGPWWSEAWGQLLKEARHAAKSFDPDCAITTEGICENFIPWIDLFDQRAGNMEYFGHYYRGDPMGSTTIPIFSYVYNEYISAYTAAYPECNRPEVLYWTRCLGKSLAQSVVPTGGKYFPQPRELNPVTIAFFKKVARAAARECWPYLMFGRMLRPPQIQAPNILAPYCRFTADCDRVDPQNRHDVTDCAVQHGAWRGPDGTIACVFVNVSEQPVQCAVDFPHYDIANVQCDIDIILDGIRTAWRRGITLPRSEQLDLPPLSVALIEIHPKTPILRNNP